MLAVAGVVSFGLLWAAVANCVGGEFGGRGAVRTQDSTRQSDYPDQYALRWCKRRAEYGAPANFTDGVEEA